MRQQLIRLLPRTDYDFSALPGGTLVANLPLVQNIDLSQWGTSALLVRVESAVLTSGSSFRIDARAVAPTDQDPAQFFRGRIVGTVHQTATAATPPLLLRTRLADNVGAAISLFLSVDQQTTGDLKFTISVDLLVQEPAVGWSPTELGPKLTLWLDQRDQFEVSGFYSDWGDQSPGGTLDFTQGTAGNRPAAGVAINELSAPSFDGTTDSMGSSVLSDFISASSYHVFVVLRAQTITGTDPTAYFNDGVIADIGLGWWGLYLKDNGAAYEAVGFHFHAGLAQAAASGITLANDCLIEWSFDGSTIRCRVDDNAVAQASAGNVGNVASTVSLGIGASGSIHFDGAIAAVLVCNVHLSATESENVRAYLSSRYGVPA